MLEVQLNEYVTLLEYMVIELFRRGSVVIYIEGRRDSGKTNLALKIMEITQKYGLIELFANNEKMINPPFQIEYLDNLEDLESWAKNQRGKKLYLLDEAGKALARRTPMSKLNIQILQNFQTLRHSDLSLIMCSPDEANIDSASLGTDVLDIIINKKFRYDNGYPNRKMMLWIDLLTRKATTLTDIEPTSLKYEDKWDCIFKKDSPTKRPKFSDKENQLIYDWAMGKSYKELGIHNMQLHRILKKFAKEVLEKQAKQ